MERLYNAITLATKSSDALLPSLSCMTMRSSRGTQPELRVKDKKLK
jgi:hypothetical protein